MREFKGTKGKWEVVEHSWSDTSIMANGEGSSICQTSIYDDATEENHEELENEVSANFRLIACAPDMLFALQNIVETMNKKGYDGLPCLSEAELVIKKALGE